MNECPGLLNGIEGYHDRVLRGRGVRRHCHTHTSRGNQGAAAECERAVIVEGAVTGVYRTVHYYGAARHHHLSVRIQTVAVRVYVEISAANGQIASARRHKSAAETGCRAVRGINSVVARREIYAAAGDQNLLTLDTLIGFGDICVAARDLQIRIGMYSVIACRDAQSSAGHNDILI